MARGGKRPGAGRKATQPQPAKAAKKTGGKRGGPRANSGRPSKAKNNASSTPVADAEARLRDRLPWLVDRMLELSAGVVVSEPSKDGGTTVYSRPPDRQAIQYLIDRVLGQPRRSVEIGNRENEVFKVYLGIDPELV